MFHEITVKAMERAKAIAEAKEAVLPGEEWVVVPGFWNYEFSSAGRLRGTSVVSKEGVVVLRPAPFTYLKKRSYPMWANELGSVPPRGEGENRPTVVLTTKELAQMCGFPPPRTPLQDTEDLVLSFLDANPGPHGGDEIAAGTGKTRKQLSKALKALWESSRVKTDKRSRSRDGQQYPFSPKYTYEAIKPVVPRATL